MSNAPVVGGDAHIAPAERTVFTEICREFVTFQRADVGIGPYNRSNKCIPPLRKYPRSCELLIFKHS